MWTKWDAESLRRQQSWISHKQIHIPYNLSCCKSLASMGAYLVEPDAWPPLLSASNSLELKTWPPWHFAVSCTGSARWWGGEKYQWNLPMSRTGLRLSPVLLQRLHSESLLRDVAVFGTDVIEEFLMGMFSADKWLSFRAGTGDLHSQGIMVWFLQWNILWRWKCDIYI